MKLIRGILLILPLLVIGCPLFSQSNTYILNGAASQNSCNCYTLTPALNTQSGSVWNASKISLNAPFDFVFNVYLGCTDANGADGIVFMLQPISTSVGTTGEGMGFQGISPSIGISLDTWLNVNRNDPDYDHISIQANGNVTHGADLAGPIQASAASANIEDCQWHTFRIVWDPVSKVLSTYFDGVFRLQATVDLVTTIFNNDPMVYWGFSAGTGGANNLHQFCTALNPDFTTNLTGNAACIGTAVTFNNTSQSFAPIASYYWNFGDGNTSTAANPPAHNYTAPGNYEVTLAITGLDGCNSDTLRRTITIGDYPVAAFDIYDTCHGIPPRIVDRSHANVGTVSQWNWLLDGVPVSVSQIPQLTNLEAIGHTLQLEVKTNHGCASTPVSKSFIIKKAPTIDANAADGCVGQPVSFLASQLDNATFITGWEWDFGNGLTAQTQNPQVVFPGQGTFNATVYAIEANGCRSNTVSVPVHINTIKVFAGNDTVVIKDQPFYLQSSVDLSGSSGAPNYNWEPPLFLNDPTSPTPFAVLQDDQTYYLTVTTAEGCVGKDTIRLTVFKGSVIYVPTGFTPNNDGRNETLVPTYVGIKSVEYFKVFNRWGELVFTTKNLDEGWNGIFKGVAQPTGTYVWMLVATDYVGKRYQLKGTSTIIR